MTARWQEIIASGVIGFVAASIVQLLSLQWQEVTQEKRLRKSLYRELVTIYIGLRDLLPRLNMKGLVEREPNPANLPEFVKADCFAAAKSSPLFWRLEEAVGMVQAHTNFGFLAVSKPRNLRAAAIDVGQVLDVFRSIIKSAKLRRRDLLKSAGGQLTQTELELPHSGSQD
jgi:hypothetical protein